MHAWYAQHKRTVVGGALAAVILFVAALQAHAITQLLNGYIWSGNIGWIHTAPSEEAQLKLDAGSGFITGYAWSENIGWIQFGGITTTTLPTATAAPGTTRTNARVVNGNVVGWVQACGGTVNGNCSGGFRTDGWDGLISLTGTGYGVSLSGKTFSGYAWGDMNAGWVDFSGASLTCGQPRQCNAAGTRLEGGYDGDTCQALAPIDCPAGCNPGANACKPSIACLSLSPTSCVNTGQVRPGTSFPLYILSVADGYRCSILGSGSQRTERALEYDGSEPTFNTFNTTISEPTTFNLTCLKDSNPTKRATATINITPVFQEI